MTSSSQPVVGVLVTCFNHERYVEQALNSLAAQTYGALQLAIVDDCSTDGSVARIEAWLERYPSPREKILGLFDWLGDAMAQPGFHGCYFQRANAELKPGAAGRTVLGDAREWTNELVAGLAREAGLPQPKKIARQIQILLDGAIVSAAMDGAPQAAATAKAMAATLIDAAG